MRGFVGLAKFVREIDGCAGWLNAKQASHCWLVMASCVVVGRSEQAHCFRIKRPARGLMLGRAGALPKVILSFARQACAGNQSRLLANPQQASGYPALPCWEIARPWAVLSVLAHCGCSSMVEQKLPKLHFLADFRHSCCKTAPNQPL